jgi:hypothetical protein
MCLCKRNALTVGLICTCLVLGPVGPPASTIGTLIGPTGPSSSVSAVTMPPLMPNMVTGAVYASRSTASRGRSRAGQAALHLAAVEEPTPRHRATSHKWRATVDEDGQYCFAVAL